MVGAATSSVAASRAERAGSAEHQHRQSTRLLLDRVAPSALHYYTVADIDATVARLRTAGVEIESEPHLIFSHEDDLGPAGTDEWMAFVRDSEGNTVGSSSSGPVPSPIQDAATDVGVAQSGRFLRP